MPQDEKFDVGKLLKGPFDWHNYIKVLVFGVCIFVMFSIYTTVKTYIQYKTQRPNTINSSGGSVDNSTRRNFWSLLEINFGGQNK